MDNALDVDVDSLLHSLNKHQQNTTKIVEDCLESCRTQRGLYTTTNQLNSSLQEKIGVLKDLSESKLSNYTILINTIKSNEAILRQKENDVQQHRSILDKKQQKLANLENTRTSLEAKLKLMQDGENLREMRDKLLAYKVLTGVNFVYSTKRVMGTVTKEGQAPNYFSYNPKTKSEKEICEELQSLILEN